MATARRLGDQSPTPPYRHQEAPRSETPAGGTANLTREQFDNAFVAACEKQANGVSAHAPGWRPLTDLVWDELQALAPSRTGNKEKGNG